MMMKSYKDMPPKLVGDGWEILVDEPPSITSSDPTANDHDEPTSIIV
jgi:hypothetical protein